MAFLPAALLLVATGFCFVSATYAPVYEREVPCAPGLGLSDGFVYKCTTTQLGATQGDSYTIVACKDPNGRRVEFGQEFTSGSFIFQCIRDFNGAAGTNPVGCVTPRGRQLHVGESATERSTPPADKEDMDIRYSCVRSYSGNVELENKIIKTNERVVECSASVPIDPSFVYQCTTTKFGANYGDSYSIVGCKDRNGRKFGIGQEFRIGYFVYYCSKSADGEVASNIVACLSYYDKNRIEPGQQATEGARSISEPAMTTFCKRTFGGNVEMNFQVPQQQSGGGYGGGPQVYY